MSDGTKIGLITFGVFMTEAIVHYNIGAHSHTTDKRLEMPPTKDLVQIGLIVGLFSVINGIVIGKLVE
jgi:hypothetical protein